MKDGSFFHTNISSKINKFQDKKGYLTHPDIAISLVEQRNIAV